MRMTAEPADYAVNLQGRSRAGLIWHGLSCIRHDCWSIGPHGAAAEHHQRGVRLRGPGGEGRPGHAYGRWTLRLESQSKDQLVALLQSRCPPGPSTSSIESGLSSRRSRADVYGLVLERIVRYEVV